MELTNEQEEYLWQLKNLKHPTPAEMNEENFTLLKGLYWDLILHFTKRIDNKSVEELKGGWKEIEEQYKS